MEKTYIITESELQALLEKQFLRGFLISGEGYNGEYPFEGDDDGTIWSSIGEKFKTPDLSQLKEAGQELEELRAWKESAMKVMPDFQEIGKLLNIPLGTSVSEQIIPKIKELKEAKQRRTHETRN
jgi:hypothetical protein